MQASVIRKYTRRLPVPGRVVRHILDRCHRAIQYPSQPVVVLLHDGVGRMEIQDCRELVQQSVYFLGYFEWRESRLATRLLRPGDLFVDVGANIGWFTLLAAHRVGPTGTVIAFEPSRALHAHLQRNVSLSGYANVTSVQAALADYDGVARLRVEAGCGPGFGSILETMAAAKIDSAEDVRTVRFDDYYQRAGLRPIRLMKIDVEGAELMVLRGMQRTLEQQLCDYLIIEVGDDRLRREGWSSTAVLTLLQECGYRLFRIGALRCSPLRTTERVAFANILAKAER